MEQKQDLRITKTYMALTKTFVEMMEDERFEEITVKELCDKAMIRKSTFYKHFADKYELLTLIVREAQAKFDAKSASEAQSGEPVDFYTHLFSHVIDFLKENKKLVQSAMSSNSFPLILNILSEQIISDVCRKLKEDEKKEHKLIASPEVMASLFTGGLTEVIKWWIMQEKPISEASLKEQVSALMAAVYTSANTTR